MCWICKKWNRNLTRLWLDRGFRHVCEKCLVTRIERDPKPYGKTKTLTLTKATK